jgi:DNA-binding IclR family transcriptional regulator
MAKKAAAASGQGSPVPGLSRGLDILRLFKRNRPVIGAPDMARELGIPRSTVHRLTQVLESMGFLQRTNGDRDYTLGPAVLTLGFEYLGSLDIVELARPALTRLRDETGYSTHLCTRQGRDIIYVSRYPGLTAIASMVSVGTTLPAHATVIGRALLFPLSAEQLRALYAGHGLERFTEQTPGTVAELQTLLNEDRKRGYVSGASFFEPGVVTVAAPIHDRAGNVAAAVSVTSIGVPVSREVLHGELKDQVCAAADAISHMLDAPAPVRPMPTPTRAPLRSQAVS